MQRSLLSAIQRIHILCILITTLSAFILIGFLMWTHTIAIYTERLFGISQLVQNEIKDRSEVFLGKHADLHTLRQTLRSPLQKIIQSYPGDFTIGFYSSQFDQVVQSASRNPSVDTNGAVIASHDISRKTWQTLRPAYGLFKSPIRHTWVYKCANPMLLRGKLIGHTFALITVNGLMATFAEFLLAFVAILILTGWISLAVGKRFRKKIQQNLDQLLLQNQSTLPNFDFREFATVAALNRETHAQIATILEQLADEKRLLTVMLHSISDGVIAADTRGRVILINAVAEKLTGWNRSNAHQQPLSSVFHLKDEKKNEPYEWNVPEIVNYDKTKLINKAILVTESGAEIPVSVSCSPIRSRDGQSFGVVLVFKDITEQQKIEAELLKNEKLESLSILAGGIAHDFNNTLAAILANLQLASAKLKKGLDIEKYLNDCIETTHKASELTKQLLTFSRGGAPVKQTASLVELIRDTSRFASRGSKVKLVTELSGDLWPVEVDPGQISQVIHNLIINAHQAMAKGGVITVKSENFLVGPGERFHPGRYVRISVKDQGTGIPPEILDKIFDPFFTTKSNGTGLGLATSYSIIRRHEGYIEAESQVGAGSVFTVLLPAALSEPVGPDAAREEAAAYGYGGRILFMEDEEGIRKVVMEMLRMVGYQITPANDGVEAIALYRNALESDEPFDAVIMDLTVPGGMGAEETMARLRQLDPGIKAIVTSGYSSDPIISDYEKFGFCGVVTKPYKFDELRDVLTRVLDVANENGIGAGPGGFLLARPFPKPNPD